MFVVAALYSFTKLPNYKEIGQIFKVLCLNTGIKGTLIFAEEGINGTVAGTRNAITALKGLLDQYFQKIEYKESFSEKMPFYRTKIHFKKEIVTLGVEGIDPLKEAGTYVAPKDWNNLISDPDVITIDTRNVYETKIGKFKNAIDPKTETFREFPTYVKNNLDVNKHKRVAMYCTGGIRCEKSTAYMLSLGFKEVYHLEGGILRYLEEIPQEESLWEGECFVFDQRIGVQHGVQEGKHTQCYGCRTPLDGEDLKSPYYEEGVSCAYCHEHLTKEQKRKFLERHKQVLLAKNRGDRHIGSRV
jgi:UPF0176 protein